MKEISVLYSQESLKHNPQYEVLNGEKGKHEDTTERVLKILEALRASPFAHLHVSTIGSMPWVEQVHDSGYLEFLRDASEQAAREEKPLYPSVHPYVHGKHPTNPIAKRGFYVFDTYTPIMGGTFDVALGSAACAVAGARFLLEGERIAYALTRPPGHHAGEAFAGGYCYINNVAVAAEYLIKNGARKVAIFDVDFHHGNGTQGIFYQRSDVLVVNIHADPKDKFPYFTGWKEEVGRGEGEGTNYNFPLPLGVRDAEYHESVQHALGIISKFNPEYLLVSLGFDTHETDPIGGFKLTTPYYRTLGQSIKKLSRPTLTVQEGGYATEVLGDNVISYLQGFLD